MPTRANWIVDSFFVSTLPSIVAPEYVDRPEEHEWTREYWPGCGN